MIDRIIYYTVYRTMMDGSVPFSRKDLLERIYLIFLIYSFRITIFSEMNSLLSMEIDYLTAKIKKRK